MARTGAEAGAFFLAVALLLLFATSNQLSLLLATTQNGVQPAEAMPDLPPFSPETSSSGSLPHLDDQSLRPPPQHDYPQSDTPLSYRRGRPPSNAFERHYLGVYRSMILDRSATPRFVLFDMSSFGFGNRIRTLSGAMFLAALTDRVLLISEEASLITSLFDPPVIDGTVLDWNASLARGACDEDDGGGNNATTFRLYNYGKNGNRVLVDFQDRYDDKACVITRGSYGHDRVFLSLNEKDYLDKARRLFVAEGGASSLSRYHWTGLALGLALQSPSRIFLDAGLGALNRLPALRDADPTRRIAIQLRTYKGESRKYLKAIRANSGRIWRCVADLVRQRVKELKGGEEGDGNAATKADDGIAILLISDSPEVKKEGEKRLSEIDGCRVVDADLPVAHTGSASSPTSVAEAALFAEWFLAGECQAMIASSHSSFGLTAFFRPSSGVSDDDGDDPSTQMNMESKVLFTVERSGVTEPLGNPRCGQVAPSGYSDISFGMGDPLFDPEWVAEALAKYGRSPATR